MSPEQAAGKPLDARSDIFSFGVVLYELLGGRRPFNGASDLEVLQTIIHGMPEALDAGVPTALRMAVDKALEKDPADRYQTMRELVVDLRRVARQSEAASSVAARPGGTGTRRWRMFVPFGMAAVALAAVLAYSRPWTRGEPTSGAEPDTRTNHWSFARLTDQAGQELYPSLSPDGRALVYASQAAGNWAVSFQPDPGVGRRHVGLRERRPRGPCDRADGRERIQETHGRSAF
jgi:serine/threonine protein kinase